MARFEQNAREANLRLGILEATADQENILAIARTYDLLVVEQKDTKEAKPTDDYIEALLLFSGRPSVIAPYIDITPVGFKLVTVAWDESASAARAVADALPFLKSRAGRTGDGWRGRRGGGVPAPDWFSTSPATKFTPRI
jgi:hypothetical protein